MKILFAFPAAVLLSFSLGAVAAEVEYRHPDLTIVAKDEPLDSVLKSISKEMRIFVTAPTGLNPLVNCDIQSRPLKQAFTTLLGDMSYSLEWKDDGEQLVGLTILSGTGDSVTDTGTDRNSAAPGLDQAATLPGSTNRDSPLSGRPDATGGEAAQQSMDGNAMAVEQEDREARMAQEKEARVAEMETRRQEEEIAHEARMAEEAVRNEAEMAEYFESQGINPNP
jgi:hypothetical protein